MSSRADEAGQRAAQELVIRAKVALEHALPRGTAYVVILQGPGFNTYGSNLPKESVMDATRALGNALQRDFISMGGRLPEDS